MRKNLKIINNGLQFLFIFISFLIHSVFINGDFVLISGKSYQKINNITFYLLHLAVIHFACKMEINLSLKRHF